MSVSQTFKYAKEYWTGDSRDGKSLNIDGYNYFQISQLGDIINAFEVYQRDDGQVIVTPLPEMKGVNWKEDLGYEDFSNLDIIEYDEFEHITDLYASQKSNPKFDV